MTVAIAGCAGLAAWAGLIAGLCYRFLRRQRAAWRQAFAGVMSQMAVQITAGDDDFQAGTDQVLVRLDRAFGSGRPDITVADPRPPRAGPYIYDHATADGRDGARARAVAGRHARRSR